MLMNLSGIWNLWILPERKEHLMESQYWQDCVIPLRRPETEADGTILLPGILQGQGYGDVISIDTEWISGLHDPFWYEREEYRYGQEDGTAVPFLSQPPRHFLGQAWYEREIDISKETESEVFLHIELTRWRSFAWVDGEYKGSDCSLCTAHEIGLGKLNKGKHRLTVCIDNRFQYPYRPDGHGVSDALGATWNGMAGDILLMTEMEIKAREEEKKNYADSNPRTIKVSDGRFLVDGQPEYFRGTHFGGEYPLTGYPCTDGPWWENLMKTVKKWGFNFIRCHSFCPPEAAFLAADKAGIYIQPECGMWNVFEEGIPMLSVLKEETERILRQFGHHPSFILFSPTNEPSGNWYGPLKRWVEETRSFDESLGYGSRRLYTAQSGWFYDVPPRSIDGTDYIYFHRSAYGPLLGGNIRNHEGWNGKDYQKSLEGARLPVICHEMGQWCAYPDFSVIEKFKGYLQPGNYLVFRENARAHGVLDKNSEFVQCSGKNQVMMYKEEIEANLRTPCLYGYEMLDLHDYLGQGTALVGILDPFWENKGYVISEEFRRFNNKTVILARISSYVIKNTEPVVIPIEICHFGREEEKLCQVVWKLTSENGDGEGTLVREGSFPEVFLPTAKNIPVGELKLDFSDIEENTKFTLTVSMGKVENKWPLYVYVRQELPRHTGVLFTREWEEARQGLLSGKRVVFSPYLSELDFDCPPLSICPVFWNSQMGPSWGRNLGLVMNLKHPAFRYFPTESHGGWQWEDILNQSRGFLLDQLQQGRGTLVTAIDDWNRNLPLSLLAEGRVGKGRLLLISACLEGSFKERPAAWSLKRSLLSYAASESFCPEEEMSFQMIEEHLFPNGRMKELVSKYILDPAGKIEHGEALYDENPNTSVWIEKDEYPITVEIHFKMPVSASGLLVVTDQKDRMHRGYIKDYRIETLSEGKVKEVFIGRFEASFLTQKALFDHQIELSALRFTALSGYGMGEKTEWEEGVDGWYCQRGVSKAVLQVAGFHLICSYPSKGNDANDWNQNRKSRTKEIEN